MSTPTTVTTVAVLGPKDSAVPSVAAALTTSAADRDHGVRVLADAAPGDRPDAVVLVVDAVCPIRPDDLEIARGVAARVPMVVALAGRVASCSTEALAENVDVTTRRLTRSGVDVPVLVFDERTPGSASTVLTAALGAGPVSTPQSAGAGSGPGGGPADTAGSTVETVDWLLARRTETITARSQSLRQDVQALRIEVVQDLHRSLRDLGSRAREELGAAPRTAVAGIVRGLADDVDAAVAGTIARADRRVDGLVARHLGPTAPATPRIPAPTGGIEAGHPPRNLGEEVLVLAMGAAGGTGVGRMLLSPLADVPGVAALILPLALLCGLALGCTTVLVRRTQSLRSHSIAVVTDRLAGLRTEVEQSLGSRILAAEATITDGFVHDPGPRVADLERRIRLLRRGGPPAAPAPSAPGRRSP